MGERPQDTSGRGDEERVVAAAEHENGPLGANRHPERVRERAVEVEGGNTGKRRKPPVEVGAVDPQQAPARARLSAPGRFGPNLRRRATHIDRLHGEDRGLERHRVRPAREHEQRQPEQNRPARRDELPQLGYTNGKVRGRAGCGRTGCSPSCCARKGC